ncbi:MAG TPA: hypothetical protein VMV50_01145 [Candidatus Paceibacterota bacterium]|nr:hypothetical protein [Candidatus Paceibacterota bacterium]
MVAKAYAAQGYAVGTDAITRYLDGPHATTFGLFAGAVLYGTLSVVRDSEEGLPMSTLYARELASVRAGGKQLAEVVQFAVDHDRYADATGKRASPFVASPLFSAVLAHAHECGIDYLCIAINPKHDRFYRLLGFEQIGEQKHYAAVDAPAIARALYVPGRSARSLAALLS